MWTSVTCSMEYDRSCCFATILFHVNSGDSACQPLCPRRAHSKGKFSRHSGKSRSAAVNGAMTHSRSRYQPQLSADALASRATHSEALLQIPLHDILPVDHQAVKRVVSQGSLSVPEDQQAQKGLAALLTTPVSGSMSITSSPSRIVLVKGSSLVSQCGKCKPSMLKYLCFRSIYSPSHYKPHCQQYVRQFTSQTSCWLVALWTTMNTSTRTPSLFSQTQ